MHVWYLGVSFSWLGFISMPWLAAYQIRCQLPMYQWWSRLGLGLTGIVVVTENWALEMHAGPLVLLLHHLFFLTWNKSLDFSGSQLPHMQTRIGWLHRLSEVMYRELWEQCPPPRWAVIMPCLHPMRKSKSHGHTCGYSPHARRVALSVKVASLLRSRDGTNNSSNTCTERLLCLPGSVLWAQYPLLYILTIILWDKYYAHFIEEKTETYKTGPSK